MSDPEMQPGPHDHAVRRQTYVLGRLQALRDQPSVKMMAGDFIWYELVTSDPDGAKRFYDSVVGWSVESQSNFPNGYRMIGRADGKFAGGVLPLTDEMRAHGARPIWLGYISVDDVDVKAAALSRRMAAKSTCRALRHSRCRPRRAGHRSGRRPLLYYDADPASGPAGRPSDVFSVDQPQRVGGTSWVRATGPGRSRFSKGISVGAKRAEWRWDRWAPTPSSSTTALASVRSWTR